MTVRLLSLLPNNNDSRRTHHVGSMCQQKLKGWGGFSRDLYRGPRRELGKGHAQVTSLRTRARSRGALSLLGLNAVSHPYVGVPTGGYHGSADTNGQQQQCERVVRA